MGNKRFEKVMEMWFFFRLLVLVLVCDSYGVLVFKYFNLFFLYKFYFFFYFYDEILRVFKIEL